MTPRARMMDCQTDEGGQVCGYNVARSRDNPASLGHSCHRSHGCSAALQIIHSSGALVLMELNHGRSDPSRGEAHRTTSFLQLIFVAVVVRLLGVTSLTRGSGRRGPVGGTRRGWCVERRHSRTRASIRSPKHRCTARGLSTARRSARVGPAGIQSGGAGRCESHRGRWVRADDNRSAERTPVRL